jgi:hypothetical protein
LIVPDELPARLRRWVADGLITQEQADAIRAAERLPAAVRPPARRRLPVAVEVIGYLGGILVIIGAMQLAARFWQDLQVWGRLSLLAVVAAVLWGAGALVRERGEAALERLRGFLWLLSSAAVAAFAGLLAAEVADLEGEWAVSVAGLAAAVHAGILWRRQPRPLQQLACLAGLATAAGAGLAAVNSDMGGLAVWAVGAVWVLAGWRRLLPPEPVALALGAVVVLVGAAMVTDAWTGVGPVLGLVSALGLLAGGSRSHRLALGVIGVAGVGVFVPWTVAHFFADTIGVPMVILVSGLALLGLTLWLLRRQPRRSGPAGPGRRGDGPGVGEGERTDRPSQDLDAR